MNFNNKIYFHFFGWNNKTNILFKNKGYCYIKQVVSHIGLIWHHIKQVVSHIDSIWHHIKQVVSHIGIIWHHIEQVVSHFGIIWHHIKQVDFHICSMWHSVGHYNKKYKIIFKQVQSNKNFKEYTFNQLLNYSIFV